MCVSPVCPCVLRMPPPVPRPPSQGTLPYLMKSMFSSRRRLTCLLCTSLFKNRGQFGDHSLLPHGRQLKPERTEGTHIHSERSLFHCDRWRTSLALQRPRPHQWRLLQSLLGHFFHYSWTITWLQFCTVERKAAQVFLNPTYPLGNTRSTEKALLSKDLWLAGFNFPFGNTC